MLRCYVYHWDAIPHIHVPPFALTFPFVPVATGKYGQALTSFRRQKETAEKETAEKGTGQALSGKFVPCDDMCHIGVSCSRMRVENNRFDSFLLSSHNL